jgi:hypothetical protein
MSSVAPNRYFHFSNLVLRREIGRLQHRAALALRRPHPHPRSSTRDKFVPSIGVFGRLGPLSWHKDVVDTKNARFVGALVVSLSCSIIAIQHR